MDQAADTFRSRIRGLTGRYRGARQVLRGPASNQSRRGLDWTNFFIADLQTGFGTFVAFYLAHLHWPQGQIGLALTVGTIAVVVCQLPGGALADAVRWKRALVAVGITMIGTASLLLALVPNVIVVFLAEVLHGGTAGIVKPVIGAISLGLVGRAAMSCRTGRNYRFAAAGHAATAGIMGVAGAYLPESTIFLAAAALCAPALVALSFIRHSEIDYARARNAAKGDRATAAHVFDLAKNRQLVVFAIAVVLYQFADASMLPMMGEHISTSIHKQASLWMSGLIIVPQIVVALLAPWVGFHSEKRGRRPLLLIGFGVEPIRAALLAATAYYPFLVVAQILDGISGATIGVLTVLVITDLTVGTGRFNLAAGTVAALGGIAASISTSATGFLFHIRGQSRISAARRGRRGCPPLWFGSFCPRPNPKAMRTDASPIFVYA